MALDKEQILSLLKELPPNIFGRFSLDIDENREASHNPPNLANSIDHTLLKAEASLAQIEALCEEAKNFHFYSVCVAPHYIPAAKRFLKDSSVKICSVIGFPLGNQSSATKNFECRNALELGADEIDMVINISALKSKKYDLVFQEIESIKQICGKHILKCILETALLSEEELLLASYICRAARADFLKTSTGFSTRGASLEDIQTMKKIAGKHMLIKASGGIRTKEDAKNLLNAGASRLGCSSGVSIMTGSSQAKGEY